jgi:hypothetical protein
LDEATRQLLFSGTQPATSVTAFLALLCGVLPLLRWWEHLIPLSLSLKPYIRCWKKQSRVLVTGFIVTSTIIFVVVGNPVHLLIIAGRRKRLILPIALAVVLVAATNIKLIGDYRHPLWMQAGRLGGGTCHDVYGLHFIS